MNDLRLTLRNLQKQPGYTVAVVVTLALAIGANSAIFSVVRAVLLRPLPIAAADDLVVCWGADPSRNVEVVELSYRNFQDWAAASHSFSAAAAMGSSNWTMVLDGQGQPARVAYTGVTASFFDTLGARPLLGRTFVPEDDLPNAAPVVVLSHGAWSRRFGANPGIVGTTVRLDERSHTIVGVMPGGFDFPRGAEFWMPVVPELAASSAQWKVDALKDVGVLFVIGRLREGVTPELAAQDLDRLAGRLQATDSPAQRFGSSVVVTPLLDYLLGPVRKALWLLFAAVGVLLLIACANVSGLLLTRVSRRRREHAIRIALGATRTRIGRLWMFETLTLSIAGGAAGLLASRAIADAIVTLGPDDVPRLAEVSIDVPVMAFTFAATLIAALLCGVGPVRHAGAANLVAALGDAARASPGRQPRRVRSLLLMLQVALAVVLLVSAGLVFRSFVKLRAIDLGFMPSRVLTMHVDPRNARPGGNEWFAELLSRITALPEVEAAGAVYLPPLALGPIGQETRVLLDGQPDTPEQRRKNATLNYQIATPGYFDAMRTPLKQGRLFTSHDHGRSPRVAILGESAARSLWPGENPIGKRLFMPTFAPDAPDAWRTVVGVVSDVKYRGINDARLDVYDPALQARQTAAHLIVRTSGDPLQVAAAVRARARELSPQVVIDSMTTLEAVVSRAMAPWRLSAWMLTLFATLAFVLASVGLFSLVSLDLASRRHELAVRLALGASRRDILWTVMTAAGGWAAAGVGIGLIVSTAGTRALRSLLFDVGALDGVTYAAVTLLVIGVVTLASYIPASRAAEIDPNTVLKRGEVAGF